MQIMSSDLTYRAVCDFTYRSVCELQSPATTTPRPGEERMTHQNTTLPPGPRMPPALQTAIWVRRAQWLLDQCAARFGEAFTLRIAQEGTWIVLSTPEHIKQVFTGDPRVFHA